MTKPSLITGCLQAADTSVIKVIPVLGIIGCGQHEEFNVLLLEQTIGYSLKMGKTILTPTKIPMTFLSNGRAAIPHSYVSSSNLSPFQIFPCTSDYLHTYFCFIFFFCQISSLSQCIFLGLATSAALGVITQRWWVQDLISWCCNLSLSVVPYSWLLSLLANTGEIWQKENIKFSQTWVKMVGFPGKQMKTGSTGRMVWLLQTSKCDFPPAPFCWALRKFFCLTSNRVEFKLQL